MTFSFADGVHLGSSYDMELESGPMRGGGASSALHSDAGDFESIAMPSAVMAPVIFKPRLSVQGNMPALLHLQTSSDRY